MSMSDSQDSDRRLFNYQSAIERFEYLESFLKNGNFSYTEIQEELHKCQEKIHTLILEGNTHNLHLVDLFQLKHLLSELMIIIGRKISKQVILPTTIPVTTRQCKKSNNNKNKYSIIENTIETPKVASLKEVAGLWDVKRLLTSLVILPQTQPQLFTNLKPCNSVLIFGPPGTGKTHIVHALASEAKANLYCVTFCTMLSSFVGETEKNLQALFDHIKKSEKFSILFIDEVDGFCKMRHHSEQDHSRRMKTELLNQMSKMENEKNMFLICATNCPWDLDTAFLRRFHRRVYIPLPNITERRELLELFTKNSMLNLDPEYWAKIIEKTEGFSGSDLSSLVQSALNIPIMELEDTKIWKSTEDGCYEPVVAAKDFSWEEIIHCELNDLPSCSVRARPVEALDLFSSLDGITATVPLTDVKKYETFISN